MDELQSTAMRRSRPSRTPRSHRLLIPLRRHLRCVPGLHQRALRVAAGASGDPRRTASSLDWGARLLAAAAARNTPSCVRSMMPTSSTRSPWTPWRSSPAGSRSSRPYCSSRAATSAPTERAVRGARPPRARTRDGSRGRTPAGRLAGAHRPGRCHADRRRDRGKPAGPARPRRASWRPTPAADRWRASANEPMPVGRHLEAFYMRRCGLSPLRPAVAAAGGRRLHGQHRPDRGGRMASVYRRPP